ncbi:hypothetical protein HPB47_024804 [Ixodes persulcatus]|uniref:Uncharacterized protein n=1 Tax=Ixodes persulcatus TaxID=34615 RepID=A0AC60Q3A4_IXOPE|nr:hypothetical protein HPB47_024804 [Ixodes persulcatus]
MDTNVISSAGNKVVEVPGMDLDPDDCAGWLQVRIDKKKEPKIPISSVHMARKASAKATSAARMPSILPKEETKVILRPRGGLDLAKTPIVTVILAIRTAADLSPAETALDTQCPNIPQNIMVISTPDEQRARRYANIKSIVVGNKTYEVGSYAAAPHEMAVKGVVKFIPLEVSANTINENVLNVRNPLARGAQRIGSSTTIIVAFQGPKVPYYVYYGGGLLKCTLYRKHFDVCRTCGKVGHRMDVCPTPEAKTCKDCGKEAKQNHQCNPKCKLCGGPHLTGDRTCSNRFKTPYVIKCRQWEKTKMAAPKEKAGKVPAKTKGNFPQLRRPRSRGSRTRSRSRSRSVGGTVTWAQKAQPESEEMKSLKEANKQQARKLTEQEKIIKKMAADMAAMKQKMTQLSTKQQPETAATDEETRFPRTTRRSTETSGRARTVEALEERVDKIEVSLFQIESMLNAALSTLTRVVERLDTIASAIPAQQWQQR